MLKENAIKIVTRLSEAGYEAVFAGGCVRDFLLGLEPKDIDIATNATPEQVEALFEKTIPVGKAFGVIVVVIDDEQFEVATYRSDGVYSDGRRPDSVTYSSMHEDALRRDLTINAMFLNPLTNEVYDFVGGKQDLAGGTIRFVGNPEERILEDRLRMLRCLRFAVRFNFRLTAPTFAAVVENAHQITKISVERIAEEFLKMLHGRDRAGAMTLLRDSQILKHIFPEIMALIGVEQPREFHPEGDVWTHTLMVLDKLPEDASDELLLAGVFHDIGKPSQAVYTDRWRFNGHDEAGAKITEEVLKRYKFSNAVVETVCGMVANHMKFMAVKQMRKSRLKKLFALPYFPDLLKLHYADDLSANMTLESYNFVVDKLKDFEFSAPERIAPKPFISGHDLIKMGFTPGPRFKEILTAVEDKQLEGEINSAEEALKFVSEAYRPVNQA